MRTETYFAGAALVRDLESAGTVAHVHHDGGDIIHLEFTTGEHAWIHLIESSIPSVEVVQTLIANGEKDLYTLFLFWADRLLPSHNHRFEIDDWMRPLLALHGDKLYGYEVHGRDIYIFPVYFEGTGNTRFIRYGKEIDIAKLVCRRKALNTFELEGEFLAADFSDRPPERVTPPLPPHPLERHYRALGLAITADRRAVKHAYRHLARAYHPDLNADPAATARMQQINEAYAHILESLSTDEAVTG